MSPNQKVKDTNTGNTELIAEAMDENVAWKKRRSLTAEELLQRAPSVIEDLKVDSIFFKENKFRNLAVFTHDEINVGPKLGVGGFCDVFEIKSIQLQEDKSNKNNNDNDEDGKKPCELFLSDVDCTITNQNEDKNDTRLHHSVSTIRKLMSKHCLREDQARFAIKQLKKFKKGDSQEERHKVRGIIDLSIEVKFLSCITHPNIIKLRGVAQGDPIREDYFLVLDRLYLTLEQQIRVWRKDIFINSGFCGLGCLGANKKELQRILTDRIVTAYDLSSALRHLHDKNLIYRDIKPDNIGFDVRGDVKLFDFGLCKELRPKDFYQNDLYHLTGLVGTRQYMAPEVLLGEPYNQAADVYSFAVLLYEVMALRRPFSEFNFQEIEQKVGVGGLRPDLSCIYDTAPDPIIYLIENCWTKDIFKRPTFTTIYNQLEHEVSLRCSDDAPDLVENRKERYMKQISSLNPLTLDLSISRRFEGLNL